MSGHAFLLTPVDTLFFRDSRPFDAGEFQTGVESLFPPSPRTLIGALRLAFAQGQGYRGPDRWTGHLANVLGDGPNDLGRLSFRGPFLHRNGVPLYPMPAHVRGRRETQTFDPTTLLIPGDDQVRCDLGRVRLLQRKQVTDRFDSGQETFVTREGLEAVLRGELPTTDQTICGKKLYTWEPRIGLARDPASRTAVKGMLYSTYHVRLHEGTSLLMRSEGLPEDWAKACPKLISLGGESRLAEIVEVDKSPQIKTPAEGMLKTGRISITLLTPLELTKATMPRAGGGLGALEGARVVSACLGKPIHFGGWDTQNKQPIALRPYLPAGSTWFCEVDEKERARIIEAHETCIGAEKGFGFGMVALGAW